MSKQGRKRGGPVGYRTPSGFRAEKHKDITKRHAEQAPKLPKKKKHPTP